MSHSIFLYLEIFGSNQILFYFTCSICRIDGKSVIEDGISVNPRSLCCFHCHRPFAMHEVKNHIYIYIDIPILN